MTYTSIDSMRKRISEVYDSWIWRDKVAKMPDKQVMAIYYKMLETNKLKKERKLRNKQLTLFDIFPEVMNGR